MRRTLIWLAVATAGATVGLVVYLARPPIEVLANLCPDYIAVPPPTCPPGPTTSVSFLPPDPTGAASWLIGGALLGLVVVGVLMVSRRRYR